MKISFRFSFFTVLGIIICTDRDGTALMCLVSCLLHEAGHILIMFVEGKPPCAVTFYGGGIHISDGGSSSFFAAAGGCMTNLLLFAVFAMIPLEAAERFAAVNLLLAAVNLIPIGTLDGRLITERAALKILSPEKAIRVTEIAEKAAMLITVPSAVMLVLFGEISFSAVVFLFYLIVVDIFSKM